MWGIARARLARQGDAEGGFTLIEALVTISLLSVVLTAILSLSDTTQRIYPKDEQWATSIRTAQVGLAGMTRELRQAYALNSFSSTSIDAQVRVNGRVRRVVFDCGSTHPTNPLLKQCLRYEVTGTGAGPSTPIIPRVAQATFTYEPTGAPTPKFVRLTVRVPAAGNLAKGYTHKIVLDDGVYMRNLDNG